MIPREDWRELSRSDAAEVRPALEAAIEIQRTRAKDTEGQVLDFLVRHCGGQQ